MCFDTNPPEEIDLKKKKEKKGTGCHFSRKRDLIKRGIEDDNDN